MKRTQTGFTLIEVLVGLGVAALLTSLVYGAIRVGQRSVHALDHQIEQAEVMRIGWQFIHGAISRAGPATDPSRPSSRTGFEGGSERLVFVARMPSFVDIERLMRITLERVAGPDGDQLLLTRERLDELPDGGRDNPVERAVLVERLEQLQIRYFGQAERDTGPDWYAAWDNPQRLPNLVRIEVRPRDGAAWPELVAAPREGTAPLDESGTQPGGDPAEGAAE